MHHTQYELIRNVAKQKPFYMRLSKSIPWPEEEDNLSKDNYYYRNDGKIVNKYFYDFDIIWSDCAQPAEKFSTLKTYQKTNHFPGMMALSRKN